MLYTGKVIDKNTGKALSGVRVTDGMNTVFTGDDGRYCLEGWERSHVVSVGLLTDCHDDWFYYTDGKSGEYDFYVSPVTQKDGVTFIHTADTEIQGRKDVSGMLDMFSDAVKKSNADFLFHTGDICREEGLRRHFVETPNDKVGCPVRYCIGNHDFCDGDYGEQLFEKLYGPVWYSFDFSGVHFVVLSIGKGEFPTGYEFSQQFEWLKNDLSTNEKPVVIFEHDSAPDERSFEAFGIDFKKEGVIAWVCGHFHYNFAQKINGIYSICTTTPDFAGIDSSVAGVRRVDVKGGEVSSQIIYWRKECDKADESVFSTKLDGKIEFCTPCVDDKYVYVGTSDDNIPCKCGIYCINKTDGAIEWFTEIEHGFKCALTLKDGVIYAQASDGILYFIDAKDGKILRSIDTMMKKPKYARFSPVVDKGVVMAGEQRHIRAYDIHSGEFLWQRDINKGGADSPSGAVYDSETDKYYVSLLWKELIEIDIKTGESRVVTPAIDGAVSSKTPTIEDNFIYTSGYTEMAKVNKTSGEIIIKVPLGAQVDSVGAPVIDGDIVYYPTADKGVMALDKNNFEVIRVFPCGSAGVINAPYIMGDVQEVETKPIIDGDKLIFAASDGKLWVYNKNTAEVIKVISTGSPILAQPIIEDGYVYLTGFDGILSKYEI